ncbi:MAG: amino acid permease [Flavobacteriales bacterium]|nr:amino acid permease [Flavobacteriales bacterium]
MTNNGNYKNKLLRNLSLFSGTMLVVGMLIGSGIFKKIVPMAQTGLSEWEILGAWTFAGIITILGALTIAGLASATEESGGSYEYFRLGFGNFVSFLSGWTEFTIIGSGGNAALAFLFAQVLGAFIDIPNPLDAWKDISIGEFIYPFADSGVKIVGIISIFVLTVLNIMGAKQGAVFNNIITVAKILGLLVLIAFGLSHTGSENTILGSAIKDVTRPENFTFYSAFFTAMLGAFWAYSGWVAAANIGGEIVNPRKNMARSIIYGVLIVIATYLLINFAFFNVLSIDELSAIGDNEIGAMVVAETLLGSAGSKFVLILILVSVFGALNSGIIAYPRKYFRMAEEKYFFKNAIGVHPKFKTPHVAFIYSGVWTAVMLASGSFDMLTDMVVFTGFIFYGLLSVALIKLKRNGTITAKVIGYPVAPILFLAFAIVLTINTLISQPVLSLIGIGLILSGIPFYYYFERKKAE